MDAGAFSDDAVVTAMSNMILLSIDAESETGAPLAKKFAVRGYPTLLFLNSDGTPRDTNGYMEPDDYRADVERIARGEGTIPALAALVATNPDDLETRVKLAGKLQRFGDAKGHEAQVNEILSRDTEGKLAFTRRYLYERVVKQALMATDGKEASPQILVDYLSKVTDKDILLSGYNSLAGYYQKLIKGNNDAEFVAATRSLILGFQRNAWTNCPDSQRPGYGNMIAWGIWEDRANLDDETKAFALEVAIKAAGDSDNPNILDTLACCYYMNGQLDKALMTIEKCIKLDPENELWKQRLEMFGSPN